jgi:hypothetical protein
LTVISDANILEVVDEGGRGRGASGLLNLLLNSPDNGRVDVGTDGLEAESVSYVVNGDGCTVWCRVEVGALYGSATVIDDHTRLVPFAAVTGHIAAKEEMILVASVSPSIRNRDLDII